MAAVNKVREELAQAFLAALKEFPKQKDIKE